MTDARSEFRGNANRSEHLTLADERDQTAAQGAEVKVYPNVDKGRESCPLSIPRKGFARGAGLRPSRVDTDMRVCIAGHLQGLGCW